jgi:hypothetical protein
MRNIKIAAILILFIFSGCTHSRYIMFSPNYGSLSKESELKQDENLLKNIDPKLTFCQGKFSSSYKDNEALTHQKLGIHTWNYFAGKPIDKVFYTGLENLFIKSGHQWSTTPQFGNIRVDVKFLSLSCADFDVIVGYDAITSITAKIDFYDVKNNSLIYSNEYTGKNTNIYGNPDNPHLAIVTDNGRSYKTETKTQDISLRYGDAENKTFHKGKDIYLNTNLNSTLLYESVDFSLVNLLSKIGKDPGLKKALENHSSSKN